MKPDLSRLLLGPLGLVLGVLIYSQLHKLPAPWPSVIMGTFFLGLGAFTLRQGRDPKQPSRWLTVLGIGLLVYGALRLFR